MIDAEAYARLSAARKTLMDRKKDYDLYENYFEGDHDLAFASERWLNAFGPIFQTLRDNLCELVISAMVSRLTVDGFSVQTTNRDESNTPPESAGVIPIQEMETDEAGLPIPRPRPKVKDIGQVERQRAEDIWTYNEMDGKQSEVHQEAALKGDGYVIVWPDRDGRACIYPNDADTVYVEYDPETPGEIRWAVKIWVDGERLRANLYYRDRIEKYITTEAGKQDPKDAGSWEPYIVSALEMFEDSELGESYTEEVAEEWPLPNPYDKVPVFHFNNRGKSGQCGRSELESVIPLQDALNKAFMDLMVAAEFLGYPQRYATGLQPQRDSEGNQKDPDLKPGMDQLWTLWGEAVKLGEFTAADLMPHIAMCNDIRAEMGRVSSTPPHMLFMFTGDIPSGEALKVVESPFTAKIENRGTRWGNTWEKVMAFSVLVDTDNEMIAVYQTEWKDAQPKSLKEIAETAVLWMQVGVPNRTIWRKLLGFTDRECNEMEAIKAANPAPTLTGILDEAAQLESQNGQLQPKGVTPPALAPFAAATQQAGAGG